MEVMITDGCFLLEMMRMATDASDYAPNDPVFSHHGVLYTVPYVRRDMLIVENQLPLLVLEKLVAIESGKQTIMNTFAITMTSWNITNHHIA